MDDLFEPIPNVLSRNVGHEPTRKHLALYAECIDKLVSVGTHLLYWELNNHNEEVVSADESLGVSIHFKRLLELLDSIARLVEIGAGASGIVLLRTLLESSLTLEFLLKSDTEQKVKCAVITDLYRQLKNFDEPTVQKITPDLQQRKIDINQLINLPALQTVNAEYIARNTNQKTGVFKNRELKWYNLFTNYNTFADLALGLGQSDLYTIVYKMVGSDAIHSTDLMNGNITLSDGIPAVVQMRNPTDIIEFVKIVFSIGKASCDLMSHRMKKEKQYDYIWAIQVCKKQYQQIAIPYLSRSYI